MTLTNFFIHNYKVAGTTIHSQLPNSYNKLYMVIEL